MRAVLATLVALLALASPARAAVADGERWAVSRIDDRTLGVFDDLDPAAGWRRVDVGPDCGPTEIVGAGRTVVYCGRGDPRIVDLATGARTVAPALRNVYMLSALGQRWATFSTVDPHYYAVKQVNLATGEQRVVDERTVAADLNAVDVAQPLCAPVERVDFGESDDYNHAPRYGEVQRDGDHVIRVVTRNGRSVVQDWRCGTPRPTTLYTCAEGCGKVQAGSGIVTLYERNLAVAIRLSDGARQTVPIRDYTGVTHTGHFLVGEAGGVVPLSFPDPIPAGKWIAVRGSGVTSDGERWAGADAQDGTMLVFDDRDPGWRPVGIGTGCRFNGGIGAGKATAYCRTPYGGVYLAVVDLRTGDRSVVPGGDDFDIAGSVEGAGLGKRWLAAIVRAYHVYRIRYIDLATGRQATVEGARRAPDLDAEAVDQPLCAPVRRAGFFDREGPEDPPRLLIERDGPWSLMQRIRGKAWDLIAWRCGKPRPHRIRACDDDCFTAHAGSGRVTYSHRRRIVILKLGSFARRSMPVPAAIGGAGRIDAAHTRHFVFASGGGVAGAKRYR